MECTLCKKQSVGKAETHFNIRLNNHRNYVKNPHSKTILACKNFKEKNHNFSKHAKLIIIDQLTNASTKLVNLTSEKTNLVRTVKKSSTVEEFDLISNFTANKINKLLHEINKRYQENVTGITLELCNLNVKIRNLENSKENGTIEIGKRVG